MSDLTQEMLEEMMKLNINGCRSTASGGKGHFRGVFNEEVPAKPQLKHCGELVKNKQGKYEPEKKK